MDDRGMTQHRGPFETPLLQQVFDVVRGEFDPEFAILSPGSIPWTPLSVPLASARIALVGTSGLHLTGDEPFRTDDPHGDTSFRSIPHGASSGRLDTSAVYVDQKYAAGDPEVAMPMGTLERLSGEGLIGPPPARHFSFCGGIVRPLPGLAESAASLEALLREDGVDAALLLPTCSLCVQTVSLLAHELEARRFSTVVVSLLPELSRIVGTPRTLEVHFPFGAPCGNPGNVDLQRAVVHEALELLEEGDAPGVVRASRQHWRRQPGDRP